MKLFLVSQKTQSAPAPHLPGVGSPPSDEKQEYLHYPNITNSFTHPRKSNVNIYPAPTIRL